MSAPSRSAAASVSSVAAQMESVGFGYADAPGLLSRIDLKLPRGSFHFVTGESGAGKTTLLKLIGLDHTPLAGRLFLFGEATDEARPARIDALRRRIATAPQEPRLLDHASTFDNAALPRRLSGRDSDPHVNPQVADDLDAMLDWVGLGHRRDAPAASLSGGERRRLSVVRAAASRAELILADEPTAGLDTASAERMMDLLLSLTRLGTAVLVASHDEALGRAAGARILRLKNGRLMGGAQR